MRVVNWVWNTLCELADQASTSSGLFGLCALLNHEPSILLVLVETAAVHTLSEGVSQRGFFQQEPDQSPKKLPFLDSSTFLDSTPENSCGWCGKTLDLICKALGNYREFYTGH